MSFEEYLRGQDKQLQANWDNSLADRRNDAKLKVMGEQSKEAKRQTDILKETHKIYIIIAFLTMMMIVFMGLQIAIDNLDWKENLGHKRILFAVNIIFMFIGVFGVLYILKKLSNKKKNDTL